MEVQVESGLRFGHRTRHVVLVLSTVALTCTMGNALILNFTIICMDDLIPDNMTHSVTEKHWLQSPELVNLLFTAVAIGALMGTLPFTFFIEKFGVRKTLSVYGLISGLATTMLPLSTLLGFPFIFICRLLQGTAQGISFASLGAIASQWAAMKETGTYISLMSTHIQLSSLIVLPLGGAFCTSSYGWRPLFYLFGIFTVCISSAFFLFYRDQPHIHRNVSRKELGKISSGKPVVIKKTRIPYFSVSTNKSIIGVWISCVGGSFSFFIFMYYGPTYMNKVCALQFKRVLGYSIESTGIITALPYLLAVGVKFIAGPLSDYSTCISEKARILLFASVSQGVMACCLFVLAITSSALVGQIAYTAAITCSGLNIVGTVKCAQMVSQQYTHFVMNVASIVSCVIILILPSVVTLVAPDNAPQQWSHLFMGVAVLLLIMNVPFFFLADSEPADFTKSENVQNQQEKVKSRIFPTNSVKEDNSSKI